MADNFTADPGSGGDTFAADDVGGIKYPYSKIDIGADGASSPVTTTNRLPTAAVGTIAHDTAATTVAPVIIGSVAALSAPADVADGDAVRPWYTRNGSQSVRVTGAAGGLVDADFTNGLDVDVTRIIPGTTATALGKAEDAVHSTGDTGVAVWAVRNDTPAASGAAGDYVTINSDSGGRLWTTGQIAHDSAISGAPVRTGGRALTADYSAVATGDQADYISTILGKQIVKLDAIPDSTWSYAAPAGGLVTTTGVTVRAAGAAGVRNYIKSIQVINSHQTISTEVVVRDGASGTVLHRGWAQAAGGGWTATFDPPLRGSAATLVEIAEVTATATAGVLVNIQGFFGAE